MILVYNIYFISAKYTEIGPLFRHSKIFRPRLQPIQPAGKSNIEIA